MLEEARIHELLEEMFNAQRTPEEVCPPTPELLPEIRARWERMQRVNYQLDALFPCPEPTSRGDGHLPTPEMELPTIGGYEVESVLGRGGMGVVFKARHLKLNRLVALKMLLAGAYAGPEELSRFRREAEAVAALRHPNIVQIHDAGEFTGRPYFTMELVEEGNLAQYLASRPQSPRHAAETIATLAAAVQFAHQSGFIHRDLKPANILLTADGTPKITDFGLARSIEKGPEFTLTGVRLGTPSYMAPEQALGKASAIGPAVDVYALGAVLYEMLTGKPPFHGQSAVETELRVIEEEPVPPSRLNPKVPRDLETICLKCLQKHPARRYASAQDLADDLHRFLDGRPVLARPVGCLERSVKWARRRPAAAVLLAVLVVGLGAGMGTAIWLEQQAARQRTETATRVERARQLIETALAQAAELRPTQRWPEASKILENAAIYLADADSEAYRNRLEQARAHYRAAEEIERIRQELRADLIEVLDYEFTTRELARAFGDVGINVEEDPHHAAALIQASPVREQLLAGLDEWAYVAFAVNNQPLKDRLLTLARLADREPVWRDRFRDPASWRDRQKLLQLATDAPRVATVPTHQLVLLALLLRNVGERIAGTKLLSDAQSRRPDDYWLNWAMASGHRNSKNYRAAISFHRAALALRPRLANSHSNLGSALILAGQFDEGMATSRRAIAIDPKNVRLRCSLVEALIGANWINEALAMCKSDFAAEPENPAAIFALGHALSLAGRPKEAIPIFQSLIQIDPRHVNAHCMLGLEFVKTRQFAKGAALFRRVIALEPTNHWGHYGLAVSLQMLGQYEDAIPEIERTIRELDRYKKLVGTNRGQDLDGKYVTVRMGLTVTLLALGRFADAISAAERALEIPRLDDNQRRTLERQMDLCRQLAPVEAELPALLAGKKQSTDIATLRAFAEWCYKYQGRTAAAARFYGTVFANPAALAGNPESRDRYHAACAAALAGTGFGRDAMNLDDAAKSALRKRALDWLKADRDAWKKRRETGTPTDWSSAARALGEWQQDADLACVRDAKLLAKLPALEREAWQNFWADVKLASRDSLITLPEARAHVARKEWDMAVNIYARLLADAPTKASEVWFEFAAVQLLSGDRDGYRQTCKQMFEGSPQAPRLRTYLLARASTLAPDSVEDPLLPVRVSKKELQDHTTTFWSLTEQGALNYRAKRYQEAVPLLERSLEVEARPGAAVLNWLWLSLAHHQLGHTDIARSWLKKAGTWLDAVGKQLPADAESSLGLHRHNWLEAHVLRREAEALLSSAPGAVR